MQLKLYTIIKLQKESTKINLELTNRLNVEISRFYFINAAQFLEDDDDNFQLTIMHTNDTHANLDKVAKKATAIKEVRAEKPDALLLDAGDVLTGTLYYNEFKGQADLEFMNLDGL